MARPRPAPEFKPIEPKAAAISLGNPGTETLGTTITFLPSPAQVSVSQVTGASSQVGRPLTVRANAALALPFPDLLLPDSGSSSSLKYHFLVFIPRFSSGLSFSHLVLVLL